MDKRMAGDYEIIQSFHIGDQEVVLGENVSAPPEEHYSTSAQAGRFTTGTAYFHRRRWV